MSLFGRRERREIRELNAYVDRLRSQRDEAVKTASTWHGTASRTSELFTDTSIVNDCLTRDLLVSRHQRVIARKAAARILAAWSAEKRRADHLQKRLDDASGLNTPAIAAGDSWQERREQRMRFDQPTTTKETTS